MRKQDLSPQEVLKLTIALNPRDWALNETDARLYGIICGWGDDSYLGPQGELGWSGDDIILMKILHKRFEALREVPPK